VPAAWVRARSVEALAWEREKESSHGAAFAESERTAARPLAEDVPFVGRDAIELKNGIRQVVLMRFVGGVPPGNGRVVLILLAVGRSALLLLGTRLKTQLSSATIGVFVQEIPCARHIQTSLALRWSLVLVFSLPASAALRPETRSL